MDDNGNGTIDRGQSFVYDGSDVVLVFDNTGAWQHRYLHGDAVDQVFMEESIGEILWGLADNQGTIRDVANYDPTLDTSSILNHREFDSFGNITAETDPNIEFRYAYTGRYFDQDSGLQYNRRRWYAPEIGRWISEDPIGFAAGDANISRYVGNAPTNFTDPSGMDPPDGPPMSETITVSGTAPAPGFETEYANDTQAKKDKKKGQMKGKPVDPLRERLKSLPPGLAPTNQDFILRTPPITLSHFGDIRLWGYGNPNQIRPGQPIPAKVGGEIVFPKGSPLERVQLGVSMDNQGKLTLIFAGKTTTDAIGKALKELLFPGRWDFLNVSRANMPLPARR